MKDVKIGDEILYEFKGKIKKGKVKKIILQYGDGGIILLVGDVWIFKDEIL